MAAPLVLAGCERCAHWDVILSTKDCAHGMCRKPDFVGPLVTHASERCADFASATNLDRRS